MEKINFRLNALPTELFSYRIVQNSIGVINVNYKLNRQKVNEYIIHIEIMKFAIYAKSAQLNSVFCLDFEFFHNFPPSRVVLRPPAFIWYYGRI